MMPARRLPWFKVWVGATRHEKVAQLDDRAFRTWAELLDAAAQQAIRGHFASASAAAAVIRRPLAAVKQLIAHGLLDERDDGVWMHDWQDWQKWRPEDYSNDSRLPPEQLSIASGMTLEQLGNDSDKKKKEKREEERVAPHAAAPIALAVPKPNRSAQVIDAIREHGIEPTVTDRDHKAIKACTAKAELIAEVYAAVFTGEYGDGFMQKRLSVHEAIGWIDGYRSQKANGVTNPLRALNGRAEPARKIIDNTGKDN